MGDDRPPRKNVITVVEAFMLAVVSYAVLAMWRELLVGWMDALFTKDNRLASASLLTALLAGMLFLFRNVDVGSTSLYAIR